MAESGILFGSKVENGMDIGWGEVTSPGWATHGIPNVRESVCNCCIMHNGPARLLRSNGLAGVLSRLLRALVPRTTVSGIIISHKTGFCHKFATHSNLTPGRPAMLDKG